MDAIDKIGMDILQFTKAFSRDSWDQCLKKPIN